MRGCFYLFRLPDTWAPIFALSEAYTEEELQLGSGHELEWYLGLVVLPMGFKTAMGLAGVLASGTGCYPRHAQPSFSVNT